MKRNKTYFFLSILIISILVGGLFIFQAGWVQEYAQTGLSRGASMHQIPPTTTATTFSLISAYPYLTLWNTTEEDTDGGRESDIIWWGEQSGGERTTLARIRASHDGASDDQKGKIEFYLNDGNDNNTPSKGLEINSTGILTDRILESDTNTFLGINSGGTTLSHGSGDQGWYNTAQGQNSLTNLTTGSYNVAQGANSLISLTTGTFNTAQGTSALYLTTGGTGNTAQGSNSLFSVVTGAYNTAQGVNSLYATTGSDNTAQGVNALYTTTGSENTAQGRNAGYAITTGSGNYLGGYRAGDNITTGSYNLILGYDNDAASATANYQIDIADTIFGNSSSLNVTVMAGMTLAKVTSDPCGDTNAYPEGSVWYNDTNDILCICNGAGADVKVSDGAACF